MIFKAPKFQLVECKVGVAPTGKMQMFSFESQQQLQSITGAQQIFIKGIQIYTQDMVQISPITPQNPVMLSADVSDAILNVSILGKFGFNQLPFVEMNKFQGTTAPSQFWQYLMRGVWQIDWTKTQVQFLNIPTTPAPFSVLFGVTYDYVPDYEDEMTGYQNLMM